MTIARASRPHSVSVVTPACCALASNSAPSASVKSRPPAFWLRTAADNPRDVALFSAMDHRGSPADTGYGKGRELRLIDGELELIPPQARFADAVLAELVAYLREFRGARRAR